MIFTIPKNKHWARPLWHSLLGFVWLFSRKKNHTWLVTFTESCRYDLHSVDQLDTNKLCGIGYFPQHHVDSARFGWEYHIETGKILLSAYCYVDKVRSIQLIGELEIGKKYRIELTVADNTYYFTCFEVITVANMPQLHSVGMSFLNFQHSKKLAYRLGVYFGGNIKAPQPITIELSKL